jgi:Putative auto-transporter adhesin, head GIN domain
MQSIKNKKAFSTILAIAIIAIVVAAVVVGAAAWYLLNSPSNQKTQTYTFTDFTTINVSSAFKVNVTQSSQYSIIITANEESLDQIEVNKAGNTLTIAVKPGAIFTNFNSQAQITMPKLESVVFSGATHGTAEGFNSQDPINIKLSGASSLDVKSFQAGNLTTDISGASSFTATGTANDLVCIASGASNLNLLNLEVNNANMNLSGASHATINVSGRLDADVSSASSLEYTGSPTLGTINSSGASTISEK